MLYRVVAPSFVAGFVVQRGVVRFTAPILTRFLRGKTLDAALETCRIRRWQVEAVNPLDTKPPNQGRFFP